MEKGKAKPALRLELAMHQEGLRVTEQQYSDVVLHQLHEIEQQCREMKFTGLAGCVAMARMELVTTFNQATAAAGSGEVRLPRIQSRPVKRPSKKAMMEVMQLPRKRGLRRVY